MADGGDTLTREQIEALRDNAATYAPTKAEQIALCDLALIGREVLPRPIDEIEGLPYDDLIMVIGGNLNVPMWYAVIRLKQHLNDIKLGHYNDAPHLRCEPTHFIPLSALPKPKATS